MRSTSSLNALDVPVELLEMIFRFAAGHPAHYPYIYGDQRRQTCRRISHVCQKWRAVAVACQELWSVFPQELHQEWIELCLARCATSSIYCLLPSSSLWKRPNTRQYIHRILPQLHRARYFRMCVYLNTDTTSSASSLMLHQITDALSLTVMPDLETLEVIVLNHTEPGTEPARVSLPSGLFANHCPPRLSELSLVYCDILLPSALRSPAMSSLSLNCVQAWDSVEMMVDFLRAFPNLEHLSYSEWPGQNVLPHIGPSGASSFKARCIHMPRLSSLQLDGSLLAAMAVYSYIATPKGAAVSLNCAGDADLRTVESLPVHIGLFAEALYGQFSTEFCYRRLHILSDDSGRTSSELEACGPLVVNPITSRRCARERFRIETPFLFTNNGTQPRLIDIFLHSSAIRGARYVWISHFDNEPFRQIYGQLTNPGILELTQLDDVQQFTAILASQPSLYATLDKVLCQECEFTAHPDTLVALARTMSAHLRHAKLELAYGEVDRALVKDVRGILGKDSVKWDYDYTWDGRYTWEDDYSTL